MLFLKNFAVNACSPCKLASDRPPRSPTIELSSRPHKKTRLVRRRRSGAALKHHEAANPPGGDPVGDGLAGSGGGRRPRRDRVGRPARLAASAGEPAPRRAGLA